MNKTLHWGLSWLLIATVIQFAATAQEPPPIQQLWQRDVQRQILASEVTELVSATGSFMALQRQALTSYTKGTAILVPDWAERPVSPDYLEPLRVQLNDYGWHTLAIMAPPPAEFSLEQDATTYQQLLAERVQAALSEAQLQGGNIIVIAKGSNAALLNRLYVTNQLESPTAFIMLGAYLADVNLNRELAGFIAEQSIPTLDISHQRDNRFANANLKLRQQLVQRNLKTNYRQRQLTGTFYDEDINAWVLKEITGWLHSIGL
ncbi:MAG: hypothetical protein CML20_02675 [Rheinheimera sp.]|uniref:DUF3530 family protein n=1 Tax=Arsukibacterium sp. UBA3155 TaxID=1946058 RepID=UPI000C9956DD|nr:DUF3530 family protein [Arsukibacterium sp. UBA3155]MAD73703.1 hypothetical protein [Rheinheimera sp.]